MRVVFDAGVVLAGAGWRRESYHCLVLAAKRVALPYATSRTLDELQRVARQMYAEALFHHDPWPILRWYTGFARQVAPAPLGKQISRDAKDDPYLACALACGGTVLCSDRTAGRLARRFFGNRCRGRDAGCPAPPSQI